MTALGDTISRTTARSQAIDESPVPLAAAIHALFLQIHPFTDGNGRTARAMLNIILMRQGYPPCIIVEGDRDRYIDALQAAWHGDITRLVAVIGKGIVGFNRKRAFG